MARRIMITNGEMVFPFDIYDCKFCGIEIPENFPHERFKDGSYACGDCCFKQVFIIEKDYLKNYLHIIDERFRACVHDGEIHIAHGKFPWEVTSRDRSCPDYTKWRKAVFDRDNYTCVRCGKVGGTLNAHHIKEYSKHPALRYVVDNGITLCEKCHKEIHRRRRD